jgi:aryl-alcohol dehydrogenase-like predicted oxidoreductase
MTPTELALGWYYHRELVTSTIIGAMTMKQLEENLKSFDVRLEDDVQDKIKAIYKKYTDPTKYSRKSNLDRLIDALYF